MVPTAFCEIGKEEVTNLFRKRLWRICMRGVQRPFLQEATFEGGAAIYCCVFFLTSQRVFTLYLSGNKKRIVIMCFISKFLE